MAPSTSLSMCLDGSDRAAVHAGLACVDATKINSMANDIRAEMDALKEQVDQLKRSMQEWQLRQATVYLAPLEQAIKADVGALRNQLIAAEARIQQLERQSKDHEGWIKNLRG